MFYLRFEATPRLEVPGLERVGGAYVNCWIERERPEDAVKVAQTMIQNAGWIVDEPDEVCVVDETRYPEGAAGRNYFLQALMDREVVVFHQYPDKEK